jgi:transcription initiation factor IIE alpha subunit
MTFEEALLEEGYTGCPVCGANLHEQAAKAPESTPVPAPAG